MRSNPCEGSVRAALCGTLCAAASLAVAGRVLYVAPSGTNDVAGYYSNWSGAASTISAAVSRATNTDTIYVTNATYSLASNLVVTAGIHLVSCNNGAPDPAGTILDGQGQVRCLYVNHADALVAGFTITNGTGLGSLDREGGGVRLGGASGSWTGGGTLSNCILAGNSAPNGGGVFGLGIAALVTHCRISANTATNSGGGAYCWASLIRDTTLEGNTAQSDQIDAQGGGGLYLRADSRVPADYKMSNAIAERCHAIGNRAAYQGGGIHMDIHAYDGQATNCPRLYACVISNNVQSSSAGSFAAGGGIFCMFPRSMLITGCTIASNTSWYCGGIGTRGNAHLMGVLITNCVIRDNRALSRAAETGAAGLRDFPANATMTSTLAVCNSLLEGNCSTSRFGAIMLQSRGVLIKDCTIRRNSGYRCGGVALNFQENETQWALTSTLRNCLIENNTNSENYYAAGLLAFSNVLIESCTVVSNSGLGAYGYGGAYFPRQGASATNTIVALNQGAWGANWKAASGVSVAFAYGCTTPTNGLTGDGNLDMDPGFADAPGGDYRLSLDSPCRDTGIVQDWMEGATDLDGKPRRDRFTGRVDRGCYEVQPAGILFKLR